MSSGRGAVYHVQMFEWRAVVEMPVRMPNGIDSEVACGTDDECIGIANFASRLHVNMQAQSRFLHPIFHVLITHAAHSQAFWMTRTERLVQCSSDGMPPR